MKRETIVSLLRVLITFIWLSVFVFGGIYLPIYYVKIPELMIITIPFMGFLTAMGILENLGAFKED